MPSGNERGHVEHLVVDDVEGLRYLANQAVVELHRWLSRSDDLDRPDLMVIDLDPPRRPDSPRSAAPPGPPATSSARSGSPRTS